MKFKSDIEIQAGVEAGGSTGSNGQVLSSTGSGVAWIDQNAITSASDFVFFNVKNGTGSTILKGKGIMAVGTDGNSGHILVDEMVADGTVEPKYFLGVLEEDIPNGGFARVISFGMLSQFNTNGQNGETWNDGQILWCDPANPGDFTTTEPDGPKVKIAAAFILNSSTNGKIQVRVQANEGIHDLHDTKITSQVDGDVLVWDNTTGVWFNDSTLNVDYTNGRVGIGTTSPTTKLQISSTMSTSPTSNIFLDVDGTNTTGGGGSISFGTSSTAGTTALYNAKISGVRSSAADGSSDLLFATTNVSTSTAPATRLIIKDTGNVGIGTNAPTHLLTLETASSPGLKIKDTTQGATLLAYSQDANSYIGTSSSHPLVIGTNNTERMRITSTGNVGIGTSSPGAQLHLFQPTLFNTTDLFRIQHNEEVWGTQVTVNDFVVKSTGNIGIGTSSPGYKLHVNGTLYSPNITIAEKIIHEGDTNTYIQFVSNDTIRWVTGGWERMRLNSSGKVGIGTSSPVAKLDIGGASGEMIRLIDSSTVGNPFISFFQTSTRRSYIQHVDSGDNLTLTSEYGGIVLMTGTGGAETEKMRITSAGNVGIGTTNPSEKLDVFGDIIMTDDITYQANLKSLAGTIVSSNVMSGDFGFGNDAIVSNPFMATTVFNTLGSESMRIEYNGDVGIGTSSPGAKLDVNGDALINGIIAGAGQGNINNNTTLGKGAFTSNSSGESNVSVGEGTLNQADASFNTAIGAGAGSSITYGNGNIVIGSLDRNGNYVPAYDITSDDDYISMGTTSTQAAYINVAWSVLSDARYKTEFNEIPHGLDFVKQLNPISYKLRKNKDTEETIGNKSYGFKAQDILALEGDDPVIIDTIKEDRLSYKESNLIPILVKAIQDLSKEVELLKQKINN